MFVERTESRQLFYTGKQVQHDDWRLIYDCPNSTSNGPPPPLTGPPEKTVSKVGVTREVWEVRHPDPLSGCTLDAHWK